MNIISDRNMSESTANCDPLPGRRVKHSIVIAGFLLALVLFAGTKHANAEMDAIEPTDSSGLWMWTIYPETPPSPSEFKYKKALILESLILINAGLAAQEPRVYGGLMLITLPLSGVDVGPTNEIPLLMTIGLWIYDIYVPSRLNLSKNEIFLQNFVALHTIALTGYLLAREDHYAYIPRPESKTSYNARQQIDEPKFHLGIAPHRNGASLLVVFRY